MSKRKQEQSQDTGMIWDTGMNWDLSGLENWQPNLEIDLSGLGISHEELEPGYNDQQEEEGRIAWELHEAPTKPDKTKQRRSKERSPQEAQEGPLHGLR